MTGYDKERRMKPWYHLTPEGKLRYVSIYHVNRDWKHMKFAILESLIMSDSSTWVEECECDLGQQLRSDDHETWQTQTQICRNNLGLQPCPFIEFEPRTIHRSTADNYIRSKHKSNEIKTYLLGPRVEGAGIFAMRFSTSTCEYILNLHSSETLTQATSTLLPWSLSSIPWRRIVMAMSSASS